MKRIRCKKTGSERVFYKYYYDAEGNPDPDTCEKIELKPNFSYFNQFNDEMIELCGKIESINPEILGEEEANGYNFEILIKHYLKSIDFDIEGINADCSADIINFYSEDGEKMNKLVDEINGFLCDEEKVLAYVKANIEDIEWD